MILDASQPAVNLPDPLDALARQVAARPASAARDWLLRLLAQDESGDRASAEKPQMGHGKVRQKRRATT